MVISVVARCVIAVAIVICVVARCVIAVAMCAECGSDSRSMSQKLISSTEILF